MRRHALLLTLGLAAAGLATSAYAQPAPDQAPPGAMQGPPPGAMSGQGAPHGARGKFEAANITHDGRLTQDQAQASGWRAVARHFAEIDRDNKGYVTLQDIKAWHANKHAARGGAMQGPPPSQAQAQMAPPPPPPTGQQY